MKDKKRIQLIHKEPNEECFEVIKSTIVEDKELKKYKIDKDTLLHELPESIVNEFLDFLGSDEQYRNLMLHMIKTGSLVMECWEDEEGPKIPSNVYFRNKIQRSLRGRSQSDDDTFNPLFEHDLPS